MAPSATYPVDERSKGVRLNKRSESFEDIIILHSANPVHYPAGHDAEQIRDIIDATPILHVSFNAPLKEPPQFPTVLPMLGALGTFGDGEEPSLYLHGSSVARMLKLTSHGELPVCVCATLFDGWVLALAPFHNSCNYRCAIVYGYGTIVTDEAEADYALKLITNNGIPERWENSRSPPTKAELTSTGVMKVRIETASVKTRSGGPNDEKSDLQNPSVIDKTWIGVVPVYQTLGDPIADVNNKVKHVPEYLQDWVADANSMAEQHAIDAIDGEGDYGKPTKYKSRE